MLADGSPVPFAPPVAYWLVTFPWEVPPNTVVVEYVDGVWRVVPHRHAAQTFTSREEALAWARRFTAMFLDFWRIVEMPEADAARSIA